MDANDPILFYLGAAFILGLALLFFWGTSPLSDSNAAEYEALRFRRVVGTVLMIVAALTTFIGVVGQIALANP